MSFKVRPRRYKKQKPVVIDIEKLAKHEDFEKLAADLEVERKHKVRAIIAQLSPRQRRKLSKIIEDRKGRGAYGKE
jgi:hypothetical protein